MGNRVLRQSDKRRRRTDLTARDLALIAEALVAVTLSSLAIKLPFRWLAKLMSLGRASQTADGAKAPEVVKAVDRASRRLPWRTVCFHQGLATHWMLRMRGISSILHYGIRTADEGLAAHVWVSLNGTILIGEEEAARHACVATFPDDGR